MEFAFSVLLFLTFILSREICCLRLKDITVPSVVVIENDDLEPIEFYCHYQLDSGSTSLVLKWLKDNQAVYQWIRGHEPSIFPDFKEKVDEMPSMDSDNESKGVFVMKPTINSTGIYKCIVQTDQATLSMEKKLQVIDIRNYTLTMQHNRIQNETHLECTINHIYPEPTISIRTADAEPIPIMSFKSSVNEDGFFDATAIAVIRTDQDDAYQYECTTAFLGLNFNLTTSVTSGCISYNYINIRTLLSPYVLLLLSFMAYKL